MLRISAAQTTGSRNVSKAGRPAAIATPFSAVTLITGCRRKYPARYGGAAETFVFNPVYGHDTVTGFSSFLSGATHDTISLASPEFANFAAVLADMQNAGSNVMITAPAGDTLPPRQYNQDDALGIFG